MSEQLKLENQLCFRLYHLNKTMNRLYAPLLKEFNLTYPQYLVMLVLWQAQQAISVKLLGKRLDLDSGTLSPLLKRLENIGYITRQRSNNDQRSVEISLTTQGAALKSQAECIPASMLAKTGLNKEQLTTLAKTLDNLIGHIEQ